MRKRIFIYAFIIVQLVFLCSRHAHAFKINIDQPKISLTIAPGEKKRTYISVDSYDSKESMLVDVYTQDIMYLPDGSNDFLPPGTTPWSCANWIRLSPTAFELKPDSERTVKLEVKVPPDAKGGKYAVVFFDVAPPVDIKNLSASISSVRLGSIILVSVKGTEAYEAELEGLAARKDEEKGEVLVSCVIHNSGNILVRPKGDIVLMDTEGNEISKKDLNPAKGGVLPKTNRTFIVNWPLDNFEEGKDYTLQTTIDYGGEVLLGGQTYFTND